MMEMITFFEQFVCFHIIQWHRKVNSIRGAIRAHMAGGQGHAPFEYYIFSERYDMFWLNFQIMLSKEQGSPLMTKQYKLTADCKWDC